MVTKLEPRKNGSRQVFKMRHQRAVLLVNFARVSFFDARRCKRGDDNRRAAIERGALDTERIAQTHYRDTIAERRVECLAVGMLVIAQGVERLVFDRVRGNEPEDDAAFLPQ